VKTLSKEYPVSRFVENLKSQAEENPTLALGIAAGLITALAQLYSSRTAAKNSKVWAKEVHRREKKIR